MSDKKEEAFGWAVVGAAVYGVVSFILDMSNLFSHLFN